MGKREIIADFEIITPMFLGEADQCAVSIRPQSIKGELAFWWRALHYAGYVDTAGSNHTKALAAMHRDEQLLFGSTGGQAAFLLSVTQQTTTILDSKKILLRDGTISDKVIWGAEHSHSNVIGHGSRYLGYGVVHGFTKKKQGETAYKLNTVEHCAGELIRPCFASGGTFTVRIILRPNSSATALIPSLIKSLKIMGLLGGLGSRKRRGYGSIAMTKMTVEGLEEGKSFDAPTDCASYTGLLKNLIGTTAQVGTNFPLSAFAKNTELRIWNTSETSAMAALEAIGAEFKDEGKPIRKEIQTATLNNERRASPLLFHVHKFEERDYHAVATYFSTLFLFNSTAQTPDPKTVSTFLDNKFLTKVLP
jgi:CRISPR-associated protein Cmr1